jgi:hypothetical protein
MPSRPFYRSRLFWLGLPGLVFLLWLWLENARDDLFFGHTKITGPVEASTRGIGSFDGSVYYVTIKTTFGVSGPEEVGFHASSEGGLEPNEPMTLFAFPPFGIFQRKSEGHEYRNVMLAWWAVILTYSLAWLVTLAWWQRRKARLLKLHATP